MNDNARILQGVEPIAGVSEADMTRLSIKMKTLQPPPLPPKPANYDIEQSRRSIERHRQAATAAEEEDQYAIDLDTDKVDIDEMGRTVVTRSIRHKGRPASVTVRLDQSGKPNEIISGTARLPGETDQQYFRQMSSFAMWQLRDTTVHTGVSWHGNQKHPFFCWLVMLITFAVLLAEIGENGWKLEPFEVNPVFGPTRQVLLKMGAKQTQLIVAGEFHRLLTAFWLHGGILHWLVNMIALFNLGFSLEREFGTPKIALVFLCCGFMGVLTSAVFIPQVMGVGASGAIFGLFGCAWADLIQNWGIYVTRKRAKSMLCQLVFGTVVNLVLGFAPMLDQFAHLGGLLTGMFLGFGLTMERRFTRFGEEKPWTGKQRCLRVYGLVNVVVGFIVLISVLYEVENLEEWCVPCGLINCIPISGLWMCDYSGCSDDPQVRGIPYLNNTMEITCPGGMDIVWANISSIPTSADLVQFCLELCTSPLPSN